ncbi:MAG: trypsin-like peptidase domain-containing protein [Roseburia sp.]|nr:trypsin-like peptidase domain-containing protein [Anaeroplasma bactoclasticum]MCM1196774.1 trypsin-like peptidase domain-containing protein [Roseburia sp.]MCM1556107.1 trypsin-like peptidase domain-containing protein [Anaeroplasma bactoclasticum]
MTKSNIIATYYTNAKELIKQKNPIAARSYVLQILNAAVQTYNSATSILLKAKTAAFLDRWILVSKDLYDKGITDYVLECFGLSSQALSSSSNSKLNSIPKQQENKSDDSIDFMGLIEETSKTQGWCAELFEKYKSAVVQLTIQTSNNNATGTGFIISNKGYLLTNDHVVYDKESNNYYKKIKMSFTDSKKNYPVEVLFSDKKTDIALCKFNFKEIENMSVIKMISDYNKLLQGADCLVIGNAFGMGLAPFTGVVRFTKNDKGDLVYTAPSNPGDSGGPVLNRQGECIGINKSKMVAVNGVQAEGYANATSAEIINQILDKWIRNNNIEF